jgi:hypothetical protein
MDAAGSGAPEAARASTQPNTLRSNIANRHDEMELEWTGWVSCILSPLDTDAGWAGGTKYLDAGRARPERRGEREEHDAVVRESDGRLWISSCGMNCDRRK